MEGESKHVEIEKKLANVSLSASLKFTLKPRPEQISKRYEVADEILQYEISYVKALIIIIRGFRTPLQSILKSDELTAIFSRELEIIYEFHKEMVKQFRNNVENWDEEKTQLSDIFISLAPFFKIYSSYCQNFEKSVQVLRHCKKSNDKFNNFLKKCKEDKQMYGNLDLEDYLLMPIQRVPRYELFLERLIKATPEQHIDYSNLQKSLVKIKQTSAHINSFVKEAENKQKIVALQKMLNMELVEPHRYWIHTADIYESTSKDGNNVVKHKCFLMNDLFILNHNKKNKVIRLEVTWITDFPPVENSFQAISPEETTILIAQSEDQRDFWMKTLTMCIQERVANSPMLKDERETYVLYADESKPDIWRVRKKLDKIDFVVVPKEENQNTIQSEPDITEIASRSRTGTTNSVKAEFPINGENEEIELIFEDGKGWMLVEKQKKEAEVEKTEPPKTDALPRIQEWTTGTGSLRSRRKTMLVIGQKDNSLTL